MGFTKGFASACQGKLSAIYLLELFERQGWDASFDCLDTSISLQQLFEVILLELMALDVPLQYFVVVPQRHLPHVHHEVVDDVGPVLVRVHVHALNVVFQQCFVLNIAQGLLMQFFAFFIPVILVLPIAVQLLDLLSQHVRLLSRHLGHHHVSVYRCVHHAVRHVCHPICLILIDHLWGLSRQSWL